MFPGSNRSPKDFQKSLTDAKHITEQGWTSKGPENRQGDSKILFHLLDQGLETELSP